MLFINIFKSSITASPICVSFRPSARIPTTLNLQQETPMEEHGASALLVLLHKEDFFAKLLFEKALAEHEIDPCLL